MNTPRLNLLAALVILAIPASGQSVGQIPVTQAGLVPAPGFNSLTPDHKVPPVGSAVGVTTPAAVAGSPAGNTWQLDQSLVPSVPPSQQMSGYVVRENVLPEFQARDLYTEKGLEDRSFRDHPGLHVGNFRNLNAKQAEALFLEDDRLQEIREFKDTARAIDVGGDPAEAKDILRATDDAFVRADYSLTPTNDIMDAPPPRVGTMLTNFEQMRLTWLEDRF